MTPRTRTPSRVSAKALRRMADHVDEQHRSAMVDLPEVLHDVHFGETSRATAASRRAFLRRAGATGLAVSIGGAMVPVAGLIPGASAQSAEDEGEGSTAVPEGDVELALFAASVERAAVAAYEAAVARRLLDPPIEQVARLFARHHGDHAGAFETLLELEAPSAANPTLLELFAPQIEDASDQDQLLTVAFTLEQAAAATYQLAMGLLESTAAAAAVATIEPIEAQHAVVLAQVLDLPLDVEPDDPDNWMPTLQTDDAALSPEEYPVPTTLPPEEAGTDSTTTTAGDGSAEGSSTTTTSASASDSTTTTSAGGSSSSTSTTSTTAAS